MLLRLPIRIIQELIILRTHLPGLSTGMRHLFIGQPVHIVPKSVFSFLIDMLSL